MDPGWVVTLVLACFALLVFTLAGLIYYLESPARPLPPIESKPQPKPPTKPERKKPVIDPTPPEFSDRHPAPAQSRPTSDVPVYDASNRAAPDGRPIYGVTLWLALSNADRAFLATTSTATFGAGVTLPSDTRLTGQQLQSLRQSAEAQEASW